MRLPGWIALAVYVTGFVITARIYVMTSDEKQFARFDGTIVGLIWPIAAVFAIVLGLLALPTLGARTRRERAETAKWEREKRETRVAELEAENERLRLQQEQP